MATKTVQIETLANYSSVTSGQHQLTIVASGEGYADSAPTTAITFNKLSAVTGESITMNMYAFNTVPSASSYDVYGTYNNTVVYLGNTTSPINTLSSFPGYTSLTPNVMYRIYTITLGTGTNTPSDPSTGAYYTRVLPTLTAPTISISGDDLTITQNDENAEQYGLYVDGVRQATIPLPALATPATPTASGTTITFAEVQNADSYDVYADGTLLGNYVPS